jgi:hypothetical protein
MRVAYQTPRRDKCTYPDSQQMPRHTKAGVAMVAPPTTATHRVVVQFGYSCALHLARYPVVLTTVADSAKETQLVKIGVTM